MLKKVLVFVPDLFRGGIARAVEMLVRYLNALGEFEVHVAVIDDSPLSFSIPIGVRLWRFNIPWIARFGKTPGEILWRKIRRTLFFPVILWKFLRVKKKIFPNIIISHMSYLNLIALFFKGGAKVIVVDHVSPYEDLRNRRLVQKILFLMSKLLYKRVDKAVAISKLIEGYYLQDLQLSATKVVSIPNPVDVHQISRLASEEITPEMEAFFREPVIVTVGRFAYAKGQWHLIRAFARVKEHISEARLLLIGTGELRDKLENLVKELGCSRSILFLDWQENPFKYIARSALFVFPSLCEGFGLALLEAMACGIPVLASNIPSLREILALDVSFLQSGQKVEYAEYGILFPKPDWSWYSGREPLTAEEEIIATSIVALLKDENLRRLYAMKARERAHSFSVEKIMSLWKETLMAVERE